MAIPVKKPKNEPEESEKNTGDETATPLAEARDFPPPTDKSPDGNLSEPGGDGELFPVKLVRNHKCVIGGRSYVFKEGERVMVPFNVKCVLSRANLLRG